MLLRLQRNQNHRKGKIMADSWIETYTGRAVTPLRMTANQVCIDDIAHALSNQCRFSGHVKEFYSVAQHCTIIATTILRTFNEPTWALCGLMHDASEAYLVDIPSPLKPYLKNYMGIEAAVMCAIKRKFNLPVDFPAIVKIADRVALKTEQRDLMGSFRPWCHKKSDMFTFPIEPVEPKYAKEDFIFMFDKLTTLRKADDQKN